MKHFAAFAAVFSVILVVNHATSQTPFWQQTNGPFGGTVTALKIDNEGSVYAGSAGVFRSTNRGLSWIRTNFPPLISVNTIAIGQDDRILVGTSEAGIYRSFNRCVTWLQVNSGITDLQIQSLAISPSGIFYAGGTNKLYRSTNGGNSWEVAFNSTANIRVYSIAFHQNGDIFFSTIYTGGGIFKSTDGGMTWASSNSGLTNTDVYSLEIKSNGYLFAATRGGGVFRSTDNGNTWTAVNNGIRNLFLSYLEISPSEDIYVGSFNGLFKSTNNGDIWVELQNGLTNNAVVSTVFFQDGAALAGTFYGGGIFRSTDAGNNWTTANTGLQGSSIRSISVQQNGVLFAAEGYGKVFRSTNNPVSWETVFQSDPLSLISQVFTLPTHVVLLATTRGLVRSSDNGSNWGTVSNEPMRAIANSPRGFLFAAGDNGLIRSTDQGNTWTSMGNPQRTIYSLASNSLGHLFAASITQQSRLVVLRSLNDGTNWTTTYTDSSINFFPSIAINQSGQIFVGRSVGSVQPPFKTVLRSVDNGATWTELVVGPNNFSVSAILFSRNDEMYTGTYQGVYRSTDNGMSWISVNDGLLISNIYSLAIDNNGYLLAGSAGAGVFRSTQTVTSTVEERQNVPNEFSLSQNYPNPFNPTTTIKFSLPTSGFTTLKVFDILGNEVRAVVKANLNAGNHERVFESEELSSGVYFYRLQSGSFSVTKKLVLMK